MSDWKASTVTCSMPRRSEGRGRYRARHEITHLVHNAGLIWPNLIEEAKPEDITGLAQLHLGSALTLTQAACRR
jgi:NADP-dependent 3-hydroxy acid dehydrogenase YdfG